jgi:aldose 1-epimerase
VSRVTLAAGSLEAQVLPRAGGSLARLDWLTPTARVPLLRGTDDDAAHALDSACFPLVPFCNRVRDGQFTCDGRTVSLAANMPPDPSPIHGQGWLSAWTVTSHSEDTAHLAFHHGAGEWPWEYEATQTFTLDAKGLTITLACRNLSAEPMPCGLGLHPYYPCTPETRLQTAVAGAWTVDEQVLPVSHVAATGQYDLADRQICGQGLDNGFDGWSGEATIVQGGGVPDLRLVSRDAAWFQVYSPASGGLFVAEPVQHANCALNAPQDQWADLGIAMLAQNTARTLTARFELVPAR